MSIPASDRPLQSVAMTDTRLWDRAALALTTDGRRRPAVAVLPAGRPSLAELFDFMRDAELRFVERQARHRNGECIHVCESEHRCRREHTGATNRLFEPRDQEEHDLKRDGHLDRRPEAEWIANGQRLWIG